MSFDLRLERVYDAPPEMVFDAFTDPNAQQELYADAPDWIVQSVCDLRLGGQWTITFGPPGSEPARETNTFLVIDRPRRLIYASSMRLPDGSTVETAMQVTFEEDDGGTRVTIVQGGFATTERRDEFAGGWAMILDALRRVVAARVTGSGC